MSKLVNGDISCPDLLQLIHFNFPQYNLQHHYTFSIPFNRTSYGYNNPLHRIDPECNELRDVDLFHTRKFS